MHPSRLAKLGAGADPSKFQIPAANQIRATPVPAAPMSQPAVKHNVQLTAPRTFDKSPPSVRDQSWSLGRGRSAPPPARRPTPSRPAGRGGPPFRGSASFRGKPPSRGPTPFRGSATFRCPPPPSFPPPMAAGPPPASVVKSASGIHPDRLKMLGIKAAPSTTAPPASTTNQKNNVPLQQFGSANMQASSSSQSGGRFSSSTSLGTPSDSRPSSDWRPAGINSGTSPAPKPAASYPSSNFNATHPLSRAPSYSDQHLELNSPSSSNSVPVSGGPHARPIAQSQRPARPQTQAAQDTPQKSSEWEFHAQSQRPPSQPLKPSSGNYIPSSSNEPYHRFEVVPSKPIGHPASQSSNASQEQSYRQEPVRQPPPDRTSAPKAAVPIRDVSNNRHSAPALSSTSSGWSSPPMQPAESFLPTRQASRDEITRIASSPPSSSPSRVPAESAAASQETSIRSTPGLQPVAGTASSPPPSSSSRVPAESAVARQETGFQPFSLPPSHPEPSVAACSVTSTAAATAQSSLTRSQIEPKNKIPNNDTHSKSRSASDHGPPIWDAKENKNTTGPTLTFESSSAAYLPSDPAPVPTLSFSTSASSILPKQETQGPVLKITAIFNRSDVVERRVVLQREGPKTASSLLSLFSSVGDGSEEIVAPEQEDWTLASKSVYEWEAPPAPSSQKKPVVAQPRFSKVINNAAGWSAPPPLPSMVPAASPKPQPTASRPDCWSTGSSLPRSNPAPQDDGGWSSSSPSPTRSVSSARNVYASTRSSQATASSQPPVRNVYASTQATVAAVSQPSGNKQVSATPTPAPAIHSPRSTLSNTKFGSSFSQQASSSNAQTTATTISSQKSNVASRSASNNVSSNKNAWSSLSSPPRFLSASTSNPVATQRQPVYQSPSYNGGWDSDDEDEDPAHIVAQLQSVRKMSTTASFIV